MKTPDVVMKIEEQIGRQMTDKEVAAISQINDEGWPEDAISPIMGDVMKLIENAHLFGYISGGVERSEIDE